MGLEVSWVLYTLLVPLGAVQPPLYPPPCPPWVHPSSLLLHGSLPYPAWCSATTSWALVLLASLGGRTLGHPSPLFLLVFDGQNHFSFPSHVRRMSERSGVRRGMSAQGSPSRLAQGSPRGTSRPSETPLMTPRDPPRHHGETLPGTTVRLPSSDGTGLPSSDGSRGVPGVGLEVSPEWV